MALSWEPLISVDDITQQQWQQLSDHKVAFASPFLSYEYLKGLEASACVDGKTGWHSYHIGIFSDGDQIESQHIGTDHAKNQNITDTELPQSTPEQGKQLIAFIPCYLKTHSYGEYVFDHAWANAYQQHQIPYYPKLVVCIPFTPVTGSRMLITKACGYTFEQINRFITNSTDQILSQARASSLHLLFLPDYHSHLLTEDTGSKAGSAAKVKDAEDSTDDHNVIFNTSDTNQTLEKKLLERLSVQFVWQNRDYDCFDDFMQQMTSRKRRSIRKERANALAGDATTSSIDVKRLTGEQITPKVMADFYLCYQQTYLKRSGHTGYLTQAFFEFLRTQMHDNIMIVMAYAEDSCIAAALFLYNEQQLYGRYWGALHEISGLHFECCYYQGIEFAIEKKLRQFNPGTQGEHKILRGFEPTFCYSNHYLQHPAFQKAVADFLHHERIGIEQYKQQGDSVLPFKNQEKN